MSRQFKRWMPVCFSVLLGLGILFGFAAIAQQASATAVRGAILDTVGKIRAERDGDKQIILTEQLFSFVADHQNDVDGVAIDAIAGLLDSNAQQMLQITAQMLGALGPKADRAVPALLRVMEDPDKIEPYRFDTIIISATAGDHVCLNLPRINPTVVTPKCKDGWYLRH